MRCRSLPADSDEIDAFALRSNSFEEDAFMRRRPTLRRTCPTVFTRSPPMMNTSWVMLARREKTAHTGLYNPHITTCCRAVTQISRGFVIEVLRADRASTGAGRVGKSEVGTHRISRHSGEEGGTTEMVTIAIVNHSEHGHTLRQAEAVCEGIQATSAQVHMVQIDKDGMVDDLGWDTLVGADGIVFGCPTHMGGPSWQFKRFADMTNHRVWVPTLWRDKFAGGFTNSAAMSGDKFSTLTYFWTLAMQHGMVWIGSGMKPAIGDSKTAPRESVNYIGAYTGVMASSPLDDPAVMSPGDLATARAYGERFATYATSGESPPTPYREFIADSAEPNMGCRRA